jgi:hypothetical protein
MCAAYLAFPVVSLGPAVMSLIATKTGDYYENIYTLTDSRLSDVHGSRRSLSWVSRLGSGRAHHLLLHRQPIHKPE